MCGIAGFITSKSTSDSEKSVLVRKMNDAIRHRGPDEDGYYVKGPYAMGMRRLSIIDLKTGKQPIFNEDRTLGIVFNGEIYNYNELKEELEEKGHCFTTHTDTETVVHLYEEFGTDMLNRLNGMFALALFDLRKNQVLFAVDRSGKKPLYYSYQNGTFFFGSELKALLAHPDFERRLDMESLSRYLAHEYVPAPHSIFQKTKKMQPGHYFVIRVNDLANPGESIPYWDLSFEPKTEMGLVECTERFLSLLKASVKRRLMSDVPLGVFLSGGIDSSSVVAMMAELMPPKQIKSFSIAFEDRSFDESSYARQVAGFFGTDHREETLSPTIMLDIFPDVVKSMDEPFADASIIPTYLLSRFTRKHVTVALGGDAGDELLAGYDTFPAHQIARFYEHVPLFINRLLLRSANLLPVSTSNLSFDFKVKKFLSGMNHPKTIRNEVWLGTFTPDHQYELLHPNHGLSLSYSSTYQEALNHQSSSTAQSDIDHIIYSYVKGYLHNDILVKVDRASMANSLEVRAPFLDVDVVEFINKLPVKFKINGSKRKYLLKKAMANRLPLNIIERPKKGFGIPISSWLKKDLKPLLLDELSRENIESDGLFDFTYLNNIVNDHFENKQNNRKEIWTILMFQLWKRHYLK